MKKIKWGALAVIVAAAASCIIPIYMDEGSWFDRSRPAFIRTVDFAPGGEIRVDNAYGNIIIRGWDRNAVEITAEETWDESGRAAVRISQRSEVVPRVDIESGDNTLFVKARPRDEEFAGDRIVHLTIQVPHNVLLKKVTGRRGSIRLADMYGEAVMILEEGDIEVENYSGSIDAELGRGAIQAELLDLRPEDTIRIVLGEGPVTVKLEPSFNGRLEADAPAGSISCDFAMEPPAEKARASGKIGKEEGALLTVSARRGSVVIRKSGG